MTPKFFFSTLLILAALSSGVAVAENATKIPNFIGETGLSTSPNGAALRSLRFVTTLDFPPFNHLDNRDQLTGFNVYLAKAICAQMKIETACTIEAVPFEELASTLEAGRADAIIAGVASTGQSRSQLSFTTSYMRFPGRFIAKKSNDKILNFDGGLSEVKIGVLAGSGHEKLARAYFPKAVISGFANENLAIDELNAGKIEVLFGDGLNLSFWLNGQTSKSCCKFVGGAYYSSVYLGEGMRIAALTSRPDVIKAIDQSLTAIQRKGEFEELFLRFFPNSFY